MKRHRVAALVAVSVSVSVSAPASAAWSPDFNVGGNPSVGPFVGVSANGTAVAQWHQPKGVFVAVRKPGAARFGKPRRIGGPARLSYMAVGANGDAVAIWRARKRGNPVYISVRRLDERGFRKPELVTRRSASFPLVSLDGSSKFAVVWTQGRGAKRVVKYREGRYGRLRGRTRTLSRRGATSPAVDMSDSGNVGVAWIQGTQAGQRGRVVTRVRPNDGPFSAPATVSPEGQSTGSPRIAAGQNGGAIVAWRATDGSVNEVWAADAAGGAPAQRLSDAGGQSGDPTIGQAHDGSATAVWVTGARDQQGLFNGEVRTAFRPAGQAVFGAQETLSDEASPAYLARLSVNGRGDTGVLWTESAGEENFIQGTAFRPAGGVFGPPEVANSSDGSALNGDIGLDFEGNAVAAWVDLDAGKIRAAFRPAGP